MTYNLFLENSQQWKALRNDDNEDDFNRQCVERYNSKCSVQNHGFDYAYINNNAVVVLLINNIDRYILKVNH